MSEAKVEKIKVRSTYVAYMRTLLIRSQEAAHKIIVRLFHHLPFVSRSKSRTRDPHLRRVSSSKKSANESWWSAREAKPWMPYWEVSLGTQIASGKCVMSCLAFTGGLMSQSITEGKHKLFYVAFF